MMGLLDSFYRVAEPGAGLLTGAVAEPIAGWAGLLGGGAQGVERTRNALTYAPRTEAGKEGQNALAQMLLAGKSAMVDNNPPVRAVVDGYHDLADMAGQYNPLLGALIDTFPTAAGMMVGGPGRSAMASAGKSLSPKAGEMIEQYMMRTGGMAHILPPDVFKSLLDKQKRGEKLSVTERVMLQNHQSDVMGDLSQAIQSPPVKPVPRQGQ